MKKSKDEKVQKFIKSIEVLDTTKFQILQKLREIVFEVYPQSQEKMMYGGIIFSKEEDFGGVFVYENHLSFEFSNPMVDRTFGRLFGVAADRLVSAFTDRLDRLHG